MINIKVLCDSAKTWQFGFQDPKIGVFDQVVQLDAVPMFYVVVGGCFVCVCVFQTLGLFVNKEDSVVEPNSIKHFDRHYHAKMEFGGKICDCIFVWTEMRTLKILPSTCDFVTSCYEKHPMHKVPHTVHVLGCYKKIVHNGIHLNGTETLGSTLMVPGQPDFTSKFVSGCLHQFHKNHGGYPTKTYCLRSVLILMVV